MSLFKLRQQDTYAELNDSLDSCSSSRLEFLLDEQVLQPHLASGRILQPPHASEHQSPQAYAQQPPPQACARPYPRTFTQQSSQSCVRSPHTRQQLPHEEEETQAIECRTPVETFSTKLQRLLRDFHEMAVDGFSSAHQDASAEAQKTLWEERKNFEVILGTKDAEVRGVKKFQSDVQDRLIRAEGKTEALLCSVVEIRLGNSATNTTRSVFGAWRRMMHSSRDERIKSTLAWASYYKRLLGRVLSAWALTTHRSMKQRVRQECQAAAEGDRLRLVGLATMERERLKEELLHTQQLLQQERESRSLLQDNLKRVFMKGVCALNYEAMNVLTSGIEDLRQPANDEKDERMMEETTTSPPPTPQEHRPSFFSEREKLESRSQGRALVHHTRPHSTLQPSVQQRPVLSDWENVSNMNI